MSRIGQIRLIVSGVPKGGPRGDLGRASVQGGTEIDLIKKIIDQPFQPLGTNLSENIEEFKKVNEMCI